MLSMMYGPQYVKLKTNLRLAANRLKMLATKKAEINAKTRKDISQMLADKKEDRVRIRIEHVIREDFFMEALEILELYCDLLITRFGLIEQKKILDDSIAEAVVSILWASPRLSTDIPELKVLTNQLTYKYGKILSQSAMSNTLDFPQKVNPKLVEKLCVSTPSELLVERYIIAISDTYGVPYKSRMKLILDEETTQAETSLMEFFSGSKRNTPDEDIKEPPNIGWMVLSHKAQPSVDFSLNDFNSKSDDKPEEKGTDEPDISHTYATLPVIGPQRTQSDNEYEELMRRFEILKKMD